MVIWINLRNFACLNPRAEVQIRGDSKPVKQYQYSLAFMLRDPGTVRPRTWEMLEVLKSFHMNLRPA